MATPLGHETDLLRFLAALADAPHRHDFYQTMRQLECLYPARPRWGEALRPGDEPVRLGQDPDLAFAPTPLAAFERGTGGAPPRLQVRLFGLLGPNGPLPTHLTEYTRERLRHAGDPTLSRFLDLFNHRFIALLYRAWAQAQPHVNRDRPGQDRFAMYVGALIGLAPPTLRQRDAVPDTAKLFQAGLLMRHVRHAEGLAAVVRQFFEVPADVEQFVGHWMMLGPGERTRLGRDGPGLGVGTVAGGRVWDRQHKFRLHLGPLTLAQYEAFLPGGARLQQLVDWVRLYIGFELQWDVRLRLKHQQVPALRLGKAGRLGWTTWLGQRRGTADASDLCLQAEALIDPVRAQVA
jgi:type VI secretion system protein ImpH